MKKIIKDLLEPIVLIFLLILFCIIFPNKIDITDTIFYLIPILGGIIYRNIIKTNLIRSIILKLKYYISQKPILWKFSGEYSFGDIDCQKVIDTSIDIINSIASSSYNNKITMDINKQCRYLSYLSGVRINIIYVELGNCVKITLESESPIKTFVRQHYNKLIQVFFNEFDKSFEHFIYDKKISLNVNEVHIPINAVGTIDKESDITEFYIGIKEKNSNVSFYKNKGFTCVSTDATTCYNAFTKYILINDI